MSFRDMEEQATFHAGREYERKLSAKRIKELETEEIAEVRCSIDSEGKPTKYTYCYYCGTRVRNQKYCKGCGRKLIWQKP